MCVHIHACCNLRVAGLIKHVHNPCSSDSFTLLAFWPPEQKHSLYQTCRARTDRNLSNFISNVLFRVDLTLDGNKTCTC